MDCQYPQQTPYGMTDSQYQTVIEEMNKHSDPNGTHQWMPEIVFSELKRLAANNDWRSAFFLVKRARGEYIAPMLEDMVGGRTLRGPTLVDELSSQSANQTLPNQPPPRAGKRERQIQEIEKTIRELGWPPLAIPDGGKQFISRICKDNARELFGVGPDPFKEAWQEAVKQGRVKMQNHEKFSKR